MKHDKSLVAVLIALAIGPPFEAYTQFMKRLGLTPVSAAEALSLMWLKEPNLPLGILSLAGIFAWVGIIVYYSTILLGTDYLPLKTMLITMTAQALIFSIYGNLAGNPLLAQVTSNFVHASAAALGGLLGGYLLKRCVF